jgi:hypothetical protein
LINKNQIKSRKANDIIIIFHSFQLLFQFFVFCCFFHLNKCSYILNYNNNNNNYCKRKKERKKEIKNIYNKLTKQIKTKQKDIYKSLMLIISLLSLFFQIKKK